jgi:hypothetical protein
VGVSDFATKLLLHTAHRTIRPPRGMPPWFEGIRHSLSHLLERNHAQDHCFSLISIDEPLATHRAVACGHAFPDKRKTIRVFLAMFARHAYDRAAHPSASR